MGLAGHRIGRRSGLVTISLAGIAAALLVAGCAGNRGGWDSSQPRGGAYRGPAANAPLEAPGAIETAKLREQALGILADSAGSESPERRANAIEGLTAVPSRLRSLLPGALLDENLGVRTVAAMAVGKLRINQLTHAVRPLVRDESPMARLAAVYALHRCGDTSPDADLTPLGAALWDESPRVRAHAAFILGEIGDPSAIPMLRDSLRAPANRVSRSEVRLTQLQIAEARIKLGDEEPLHEVRAALYPSRPDDLEATALAAQILGLVGDRRSIDQLIYLTARKDEVGHLMPAEIRLAAAGSLARLGVRQGGFLAREYAGSDRPVLRAQAAHVFGQTGLPENLPALAVMLSDPDPMVQTAAAAAVLQITERGSLGR